MADTVRLRHTVRRDADSMMYYYDGEVAVKGGIIEIPATRRERIQRAWIMGFRATVEGRVIANLDAHIRAELARDEVATEPDIEHTDLGAEFVHTDNDECPCLKAEACCGDECCQPEDDELALLCCQDAGCCENNDDTGCGCAVTPVDETETAKSGEGTDDEGIDAGRQPAGDDGVRSSESASDGSDAGAGDDSGVGDESPVRGTADEPAA